MIACPGCRSILPPSFVNTGERHYCPQCRGQVRADLFNAFYRPTGQVALGEKIIAEGTAECFYHPGKMAVAPCTGCGRLLCALCEVSLDGRSLCMNCLRDGKSKGRIERLENKRLLFDSLAFYLAFLPLLFFFITPLTAPAAIYIVVRYWNAPASMLPRTRIRFVAALLMALLQVAGWAIFLAWMLR